MLNELKPCPFCGGDVIMCDNTNISNKVPVYWVDCPNCTEFDTPCFVTEKEVLENWNTRPIEDALRKEIAQLQADNQSLVEQVNAMAKKIDGLTEFIGGLDDCDIFDQNNLSRELETYFKGATNERKD